MARPLRYEASGAIYHVMARGEGGKDVFEDEVDRTVWLKRLEEVCGSYGWRVHAWVMMGNHFHLLLETPEANLVAGMKWFMGVFSQGWNRRRKRLGHVFQGRYKAVVVNGEGSGEYFRIVADYIHLNPVRIGWVGGGSRKKLKSWRWSSFPNYAGRKSPDWLVTDRVLEAFALAEGRRGMKAYERYLEERAKDQEGTLSDDSLKALRRGWYLGEKSFGKKLLAKLKPEVAERRRKGSLRGEAARAHDVAEAERLVKTGLKAMGLPGKAEKLVGRGKWLEEKSLLATLIRKRTGVRNRWIADRLGMGHEGNVTVALRRVRESKALTRQLGKLEKELGLG
ncbi:transposase [Haloferula rosea]|uniref:Transposase n=1 Tax=Haloferula rosea TaxID=490093 RepID=A0A934REK5_9BACT|nr:transposase [Haloferula rosea]MBK1829075.1 transposase [Haloferula rosea]